MPEQQQLEEARELLRTGRYEAARACLDGCEEWPVPLNAYGAALRAEVLLRVDPIDALESLARLSDLFTSGDARFDYYVISGRAYANSRNFAAAWQMFDLAAAYVASRPHGDCELAHHRARLRYLEGSFDPKDPDIALALTNPDPGARVGTLVVRSWMYAGIGQYRAQIEDLREALAIARHSLDRCDAYTLGRALHSLLRIAFELGDAEAASDGESFFEIMPWTAELADAKFLCVRALAWNAFLYGETARAQWLFRDSKALAPNDAWRVMAHADRAFVARISGNEAWALEELAQAEELARSIVWAQTVDEERQALVTLAALLAPSDMARAQRFVSTYVRLGTQSLDPSLAIAHDPRTEGFSQYALGRVHSVLNNAAASAAAFETAYYIFDRANHHFRAALAAQGLYALTREPVWIERARAHAEAFPKSAFNTYLNGGTPAATTLLDGLTPFQMQLARGLCAGFEIPALSQRLSRSEFTIKREVRELYERLGVDSRKALRELFDERGAL